MFLIPSRTSYATLGFMHAANLDDGGMWPTDFAVKDLTNTEEVRSSAVVKTGVS